MRRFSWVLPGLVLAGLLQAPAAQAAEREPYAPPSAQPVASAPVRPLPAKTVPAITPLPQASAAPAPVWPGPGAQIVTTGTSAAAKASAPPKIRAEVLDRAMTGRAKVQGVLLGLTRSDGGTGRAPARVSVDYRSFATAYGADWSTRLRLKALPECALSTPAAPECQGTPLNSENDITAKTVSADVLVGATRALVAVDAEKSGPAGDYKATPLKPTSTWAVGGNTGSFTWNYPMRVPPALGGPAPELSLSYSSQSVDGMHAASNNQPNWIGEGFEQTFGGSVERRYMSCGKDMDGSANNDKETGDLCYETDNAVLTLGAHSGELIYNSGEKRWHLRSDDGSRIERRTGATNGDNDGEHWVLTTTDGVQYWFGLNRLPGWAAGNAETGSTLTAPIFGNDPDEPCHATTFADSDCTQAWRWNLDYVVDPVGNSMSLWYTAETNKYARNLETDDDASYERGAWLERIDYGTRRIDGTESVLSTPAPMSVAFDIADRCLSGCSTHDGTHWPDVPWDANCTDASCPDNFSPTFWSTKRLASITTRVRNSLGTGYTDVDRWTLTHTFPDPGDGTRAGLWLSKLGHTGLVGGSSAVPDVEFTPVQKANRVDVTGDFAAAMKWMRITRVRTDSGATIDVTYSDEDCKADQTPAAHENERRCYPVRWTPEGYKDPVTDWFHKYVVTKVYEDDVTGGVAPFGSPQVEYNYTYDDGAAWHYNDDDGLIDKGDKTWSDYRGYGKVGVTVGSVAGEKTYTELRYFRGMNGDRAAPSGGSRAAFIDGIADEDWYAGLTRESKVLNGPDGPVVQRELNTPWSSPATATRTVNGDTVTARYTRIGTSARHTTLDGGRGERIVKTSTTYDSYGMATQVEDLGLDGVTGDEQCTKTDYAPRNADAWVMDKAHQVRTFAVACSATGGTLAEADVVSHSRTRYDDQAYGQAPVKGLATHDEEMSDWNGGAPAFIVKERTEFDAHGRAKSTWDALNFATTVAYTPATDGPVTAQTTTNPLGHETTTNMQPAWGLLTATVDPNGKRTDLEYDPMGRLLNVWAPGRARGKDTPTQKFDYAISATRASSIATSQLDAAGRYQTTYEIFDGLLRQRQTQQPGPNGGRILTEQFYDSAGRPWLSFGKYHVAGTPSGVLDSTTDKAFVKRQNRTIYDGAGRAIHEIFQPDGFERWRTSTVYAGDRTDVTPPKGGTATSKIVDARDRVVELRQYHNATPTPSTAGSWDRTQYAYDRRGNLTKVLNAADNKWTYEYDVRGRQTATTDPDQGRTVTTYDNADQIATVTDGRSKKVAYQYDQIGRKRGLFDDRVGGAARAQWIYDTVQKGQLSQSTRVVGSAQYQVKYLEYSPTYKPLKTQVVIPTAETGVGGTYNFSTSYNADESVATSTLPDTNGDLAAETVTYGYDGLGNPRTMTSLLGQANAGLVESTVYSMLGDLDQVHFNNSASDSGKVWTTYRREDDTGRLTGISTDRATATPNLVVDTHYTFDDAGNILEAKDAAADDTQCFAYDHLRRLTEAWTPASDECSATPAAAALGGPAPYWLSWTLDAVGNRKSETAHTSTGDKITGYTYAASGENSKLPHAVTAVTGAATGSFTYDDAGNMLTRPTPAADTQTMTWDAEGNLETSKDGTGETRYIYDADGNRLIRRDPAGRTLYLPNQELRYSNATQTTTCTRFYTYAGSTVASRSAAGLTWLSSDHQGTAVVAIDAATQRSVVRRQTPYGTARGATVTWPNEKGFVGGTNDNTGLTHLGARLYDAALGRFISVDPVLDLQDPQQINGYAYSNNSPITLSDPSGLRFDDETGADYNKRLQKHRTTQAKKQKKTSGGKSWIAVANNTRHRAAQEAARDRIKRQVADMGGEPAMVRIEYPIKDACTKHKRACGEPGKADIVYIDESTRTIYIWEVKIAHLPHEAESDLRIYVKAQKANGPYKNVERGFALTSMAFKAVPNTRETVVVSNGPTQGSILYRPFRWRKPKATPPPPPAPVTVTEPKKVPAAEPKTDYTPVIVGVGAVVVVGGLVGLCALATAGVCGVVVGGAVLGTVAATS